MIRQQAVGNEEDKKQLVNYYLEIGRLKWR